MRDCNLPCEYEAMNSLRAEPSFRARWAGSCCQLGWQARSDGLKHREKLDGAGRAGVTLRVALQAVGSAPVIVCLTVAAALVGTMRDNRARSRTSGCHRSNCQVPVSSSKYVGRLCVHHWSTSGSPVVVGQAPEDTVRRLQPSPPLRTTLRAGPLEDNAKIIHFELDPSKIMRR